MWRTPENLTENGADVIYNYIIVKSVRGLLVQRRDSLAAPGRFCYTVFDSERCVLYILYLTLKDACFTHGFTGRSTVQR